MADLVDRTGCEVYIHIMDKPKLTDDAGMLANLFRIRGHRNYTGKVNVFTEDDILKLDELEFDVLETPGQYKRFCLFHMRHEYVFGRYPIFKKCWQN